MASQDETDNTIRLFLFASGTILMSLEMLGGRVLAPYTATL
jgi:hypothetical protein